MVLWLVAGAGQNLVNLPTQTLIADRIPTAIQERVYGAAVDNIYSRYW
jgi:NRE family putative nickel resistance protein-like MFS transporter